MGRPNKVLAALSARVRLDVSREFASDIFEPAEPLTPEEELEARRSELRNGLTDLQRLFLFGKLDDIINLDYILPYGFGIFGIYEGLGHYSIFGLLPALAGLTSDYAQAQANAIANMPADVKAEYQALIDAGASPNYAFGNLLLEASNLAQDSLNGYDLLNSQLVLIDWATQFTEHIGNLVLPVLQAYPITTGLGSTNGMVFGPQQPSQGGRVTPNEP
jgi:hypothetical protein